MMKKYFLLASMSITICKQATAQNLVPNGSFEIYGSVPCGWAANPSAFNTSTSVWTTPTNGTPDIHSTLIAQNCSNFHPNSTYPSCKNGSQVPHSGNIFAGFYTYNEPFLYREYLQAQLSAPMIPGITYYVELYVSLADSSEFATNNMGVGFSTTVTNLPTTLELGYAPQILFTSVISNTANWVLLKDSIVPTQAYQYIIIGNFFNDSATNIVSVFPGSCVDKTYYYCDDVSITASTVNIEEIHKHETAILYPNPINEKLNISISTISPSEIILYDLTSRKLLQRKFTNTVTLNTSQLAKGMYLYEVRTKNDVMKKGKVVKE